LNSFWLFPILVKDPDNLKRFLARHGIDSSKFLLALIGDEESFSAYGFVCESARYIREHTLFIPVYSDIGRDQLDYIVQAMEIFRD
jgi:dTDP-4-amino-4,6-dideoxygalactose transaminase